MTTFPKSRTKDLVVQELDKELLIYDLNINKAFCLNETSATVFQLCNGNNSVAEIADLMSKKLKMLVSEEVVWLALDQLKKDNLLEGSDEFAVNFNGLTRRQVIKKVGLASMIALPVIASVVAPSPAIAASLLGNCLACTSPSDCAINNCLNMVCSVGTTNSFPPGTMVGTQFGETFPTCNTLAMANCCSGLPSFFVSGNCYCD